MYPSFITNNGEETVMHRAGQRFHLHELTFNSRRNGAAALFSKIDINKYYIEVGAVYEILNLIRKFNFRVPFINEPFHEVITSLQTLLEQIDDATIEDLLFKNSSLCKCKTCGVISHSAKTAAESNQVNSIHKEVHQVDISNHCNANDTGKETEKVFSGFISKFPCNKESPSLPKNDNAAENNKNEQRSNERLTRTTEPPRVNDPEEIIKQVSYSNEKYASLTKNKNPDKFNQTELSKDCLNIADTVNYLVYGDFTKEKERENQFPSQIEKHLYTNLKCNRKKSSFALHNSHDVDFRRGFWLSKNTKSSSSVVANKIGKYPSTEERNKMKSHYENINENFDAEEKDSLENYSVSNIPTETTGSNTTACSTSSIEKMMGGRTKSRKKNVANVTKETVKSKKGLNSKTSHDLINFVKMKIIGSLGNSERELLKEKKASRKLKKTNSLPRSKILLNLSKIFKKKESNKPSNFPKQKDNKHKMSQLEDTEIQEKLENREDKIAEICSIYENLSTKNKEIDWHTFQKLVKDLHPHKTDLWCDICTAISNEAKRIAVESGSLTEVCIEITPILKNERTSKLVTRGNEITFEMDMIVPDPPGLLEKAN
ncbi:uncharacterized protein [Prorops nasuta]|uniref:uncharacterized protein n=1 Tax=Prorops nasuta TaxID=863751 RepID=UPI0034CE9C76